VIAARGIAKDANLGAPSAPLSGDYCGKAIHRSFIVARRLAPHKIAEQPHHVLLAILQFAENFSHCAGRQSRFAMVHYAGMLAAAPKRSNEHSRAIQKRSCFV
jgi:hypothetical protein